MYSCQSIVLDHIYVGSRPVPTPCFWLHSQPTLRPTHIAIPDAIDLFAVRGIEKTLKEAGVRTKVDWRDDQSPGWKFSDWEMRGVPVRIEVGPKDVEKKACVMARRDMPGKEGKTFGVPQEPGELVAHVNGLLDEVQAALLAEATKFRDENIVDVGSYEELKAAVEEGKWARAGWAGSDDDERRVKEETGATLRCFPFEQPAGPHTCIMTGGEAAEVAIFAKAY